MRIVYHLLGVIMVNVSRSPRAAMFRLWLKVKLRVRMRIAREHGDPMEWEGATRLQRLIGTSRFSPSMYVTPHDVYLTKQYLYVGLSG